MRCRLRAWTAPAVSAPESTLFETHCHLDVAEFDGDRDAVIERARAAGVGCQLIPAIDAANWPKIRRLCADHADLLPAYGLHPLMLDRHRDEHLVQLEEWLQHGDAVAVGECGLDYYVEDLDRDLQQHYFDAQLQLAKRFDLPLILHARRAVEDVTLALRRVGGLRGVVHSFSGSEEQARQLFELGFCIGIGGPVTYERARRIRRVVTDMPIEHLLLETDSPDQPCCGHQGQRNEPAMMREVLRVVAALRGISEQECAEQTTANARRVFGGS